MVADPVERIETVGLRVPLSRAFYGSHYAVGARCPIVTRVITRDGVVGEVYNGDDRANQEAIVRAIRDELAPVVVGQDIFAIGRLWEEMIARATADPLRDPRIGLQAVACVESALWDALGKHVGRPLADVWGRYRCRLPVMVIGGYYDAHGGWDEAAIVKEAEEYRRLGVRACKFKVGGLDPAADAARVRILRKALGEDFTIAVDANQAWGRREALEFVGLTRDLRLYWFEEPVQGRLGPQALRDVRLMGGIPVTAGQSELTPAACVALLTDGAIDICNFDASAGGGIIPWRRVALAAESIGQRMAHHEEGQIAAQLLAATEHAEFLEVFLPERDPVVTEMLGVWSTLKDGLYEVPDRPGFGLNLDPAFVARYRVL
jgi:D-galactarolactone cycloisomerase